MSLSKLFKEKPSEDNEYIKYCSLDYFVLLKPISFLSLINWSKTEFQRIFGLDKNVYVLK